MTEKILCINLRYENACFTFTGQVLYMNIKFSIPIVLALVLVFCMQTACKKDAFLTNGGELRFSTDTLTFDTVFTSLGSFTTQVKIYNPQNQKVNISSIRLAGSSGQFHINVDGIPGSATNIELAAKDSMYVFATVRINPDTVNAPFIVEDKLVATMNGKDYVLPFMAYGQNAYYIYGETLNTQTWKTDKPYVIIHSAEVAANNTLTIPHGCRVYMHADSRLYVSGTLKTEGIPGDSVIFQGDRLDRKYYGYEGYPGEWGGIYFDARSQNSEMKYTVLKNGGSTTGVGLPAVLYMAPDSVDDNQYQLRLRNVIVENSIGYGILGFNSTVYGENCLINTCGAQGLATFEGGQYDFINTNFITYGTNKVSHTNEPTVALINYRDLDDVNYIPGHLVASFTNCVIYGSLENELFAHAKGPGVFDVKMKNCLIKVKDGIVSKIETTNCIINRDPQFENASQWDYRPKSGSPLIGAGDGATGISIDIAGKPRSLPYDIGCYEYQ